MAAFIDGHSDNVAPIVAATINGFCGVDIKSQRYLELTEDLWILIFIRLSVKSLLRVMCVCKHWYTLIKDPSFTGRHLQFQKMVSKNNGHFLLLHHNQSAWVINHFLFDGKSITNVTSSSFPLLSYRNILPFYRFKDYPLFNIDGPINGLYCLHNQEGHIVIWNPATIEVGFVPLPEQCIPPDFNDDERYLSGSVVGFGTDPLDEENYKVILFSRCLSAFSDDEFVCVMLYTTRTNTWRLLNDAFMVVRSLNNTYLNGFYYWKGENCTAIVFDMSKKEAFRRISTPCHGDLALHNDRLTLFSMDNNLNEIDIWVMLEENNWLKKISVRGIQQPLVKPLGFCDTEKEMFLVIRNSKSNRKSQIIRYNITTQEFQNFGPRGYHDGSKAFVYYESLVSLSGGITKYKGIDYVSFVDMVWKFLLEESPVF